MKKIYFAVTFTSIFMSNLVIGQNANYYQSLIVVNNGSGNVFYDAGVATSNPDFNGVNLGTFTCTSSLNLNGGQSDTKRGGGCEITSSKLAYRVYLQGSVSLPTFTFIDLPFTTDFGSCFSGNVCQRWEKSNAGINLLTGLANGTYVVETYFVGSTQFCNVGDFFDNNSNSNYKATFAISNPITISAPTIASNSTICYGTNTSLSATAIGSDNYVWQEEISGVWSDIALGTPMNLAGETVITTISNVITTRKIRCKFTNCSSRNAKTSEIFTVTPQRPTITVTPVDAIKCFTNVARFYIAATNVSYLWQRKRALDADFVNLTETNDVTLTTSNYLRIEQAGSANNLDGTLYRCKITDLTTGCINTSNNASLLVNKFRLVDVTKSPLCVGEYDDKSF